MISNLILSYPWTYCWPWCARSRYLLGILTIFLKIPSFVGFLPFSLMSPLSLSKPLVFPSSPLPSLMLESHELQFAFCRAELFSCRHATFTYSGAFDRCSPSCSFRLTALVWWDAARTCVSAFGLWSLNRIFSGDLRPFAEFLLHLSDFRKLCMRSQGLPRCAVFHCQKVWRLKAAWVSAQRCFTSPQSFLQLVSVCRSCQGQTFKFVWIALHVSNLIVWKIVFSFSIGLEWFMLLVS